MFIAVLNRIYLRVKLKQLSSVCRSDTVSTPLKKYRPVIMVVNVRRPRIIAIYHLISVDEHAAILYAKAPMKPGAINTKKY